MNACSIPLENSAPYSALYTPAAAAAAAAAADDDDDDDSSHTFFSPLQLAVIMAQRVLEIVSLRSAATSIAPSMHNVYRGLDSIDMGKQYGHKSFTEGSQERLLNLARGVTVASRTGPPSIAMSVGGVGSGASVASPPLDAARVSRQTARVVLTSPNSGSGAATQSPLESHVDKGSPAAKASEEEEDEDDI